MLYFNESSSLEEIKAHYKDLAKQNHPDLGGDVEVMKAINEEYQEALRGVYRNSGNTLSEIEALMKRDTQAMEALQSIIGIEGISIEICGVWLWITGDTKAVKDKLKEASFKWSSKKTAWYWRPPEQKFRRYGKRMSLDDIRLKYGTKGVKSSRMAIK